MINKIYKEEYLRLPTKADLTAINKLHHQVHSVEGMFGSLDCMHTYWKNCPVAWAGQYKGHAGSPTIVMEAVCDYHMWFWHASYGYCGTLSDLNILDFSPFLDSLLDGSFAELESAVVPYKINDKEFHKMYLLVDGIYPKFSRFVKTIPYPTTEAERKFSAWQEAARKDIERAFGVLQQMWQCIGRPFHQLTLKSIAIKVSCCMILHNMCMSDRVMGDPRARYNPAHNCSKYVNEEYTPTVQQPPDLNQVQDPLQENGVCRIGLANGDLNTIEVMRNREAWVDLNSKDQHVELHKALLERWS